MITLKRLLIALFAITASGLLVVGIGIANAETPAERCKRETTAYNNTWKNTWAQANPGKSPSDAPPPPVPYTCGGLDDGPPPSLSPSTPTADKPTETAEPTTPERGGPGPGMTAPTEKRQIEHPRIDAPTIVESNGTPPRNQTTTSQIPSLLPTLDVGNPAVRRNADYSYGPGKWTTKACADNPIDCNRSRKAGDQEMAERESVKYFPGNPESTRQDAARHCIWQGLTTESSNAGFAEQVGNAHELDSGSPIEGSSAMDLHNNMTGREVGKRHEGDRVGIIAECVSLARNAKRWNPRTAPPNRDGKGLIYIR